MTNKTDENFKNLVMTGVGVIAIILVYILAGSWASSDIAIFQELSPYVLWIGLALLVFYIFLFVSNSQVVKIIKGEFASQAFLTALITFCVLSSSIEAASSINRVFSMDASAFPNTFRIMTFVHAFIMGKILFWAFFLWSVFSFICFLFGGDKDSWQAWIFMISGITISGIALLFIHFSFSSEQLDKRVYLLARAADFYSKVNCPGLEIEGSAVFLGPEQRRILFDRTSVTQMSLTRIITQPSEKLIAVPPSFQIYSCKDSK